MKTYELFNENLKQADENKKRIFVFVTKDHYKTLMDLKYKYRLSFGYIIRIIAFEISLIKPLDLICQDKPLYHTSKWRKTSLKVENQSENSKYNAKYYNNALIIYLDKLDKQLLDEKIYQKWRNDLNNKFATTQDPLWQYNEFYRMSYLQKKFEK